MLPNWLIYGVAVICGLLTWRDVKWGLTGIAIAIGISPEYRTEFAKDLRLEDFVMVAVFLAWLIQKARDREPIIPFTPPQRALGLLAFYRGNFGSAWARFRNFAKLENWLLPLVQAVRTCAPFLDGSRQSSFTR